MKQDASAVKVGEGIIGEKILGEIGRLQNGGKSSLAKAVAQPEVKAPASEVEDQEIAAPASSVTQMFVAKHRKAAGKPVVAIVPADSEIDLHTNGNIDLSDLTVKVNVGVSSVDADKIREQVKLRSEQLFGSAENYFKMCRRIDELAAIKGVELTDFGMELGKLQNEKKRFDSLMKKQPQGIRNQFGTDLMIVSIDNLIPKSDSDIIDVFNRIEKEGRARKASAEEISKIPLEERLFFVADNGGKYNLVHNLSQMSGREDQVSGADRRIFKAVRKLIWRYLDLRKEREEAERQAEIAKCGEIRRMAGMDPRGLLRRISGTYVYYLSAKKAENDKAVGMPGAAKVEVYTFTKGKDKEKENRIGFRILEAAGTLKPRWEHPKFGWSIPLWWLEEYVKREKAAWKAEKESGKKLANELDLLPESIPQEIRVQVLSFFKKFFTVHRQAVMNARKMDPVSEQSKQVLDEMANEHESMRAGEPASELVEA